MANTNKYSSVPQVIKPFPKFCKCKQSKKKSCSQSQDNKKCPLSRHEVSWSVFSSFTCISHDDGTFNLIYFGSNGSKKAQLKVTYETEDDLIEDLSGDSHLADLEFKPTLTLLPPNIMKHIMPLLFEDQRKNFELTETVSSHVFVFDRTNFHNIGLFETDVIPPASRHFFVVTLASMHQHVTERTMRDIDHLFKTRLIMGLTLETTEVPSHIRDHILPNLPRLLDQLVQQDLGISIRPGMTYVPIVKMSSQYYLTEKAVGASNPEFDNTLQNSALALVDFMTCKDDGGPCEHYCHSLRENSALNIYKDLCVVLRKDKISSNTLAFNTLLHYSFIAENIFIVLEYMFYRGQLFLKA